MSMKRGRPKKINPTAEQLLAKLGDFRNEIERFKFSFIDAKEEEDCDKKLHKLLENFLKLEVYQQNLYIAYLIIPRKKDLAKMLDIDVVYLRKIIKEITLCLKQS